MRAGCAYPGAPILLVPMQTLLYTRYRQSPVNTSSGRALGFRLYQAPRFADLGIRICNKLARFRRDIPRGASHSDMYVYVHMYVVTMGCDCGGRLHLYRDSGTSMTQAGQAIFVQSLYTLRLLIFASNRGLWLSWLTTRPGLPIIYLPHR